MQSLSTCRNTGSLEETARRLCESRGGRWSGTKGMARCPAHDDRTPSLGVTLGRHAILFHCFAGCDQASVIEAFRREGTTPASLFAGPSIERSEDAMERRALSRGALRIWRDACALKASPAKAYLEARGITAASPALRFHPQTPLGPKGRAQFLPAMIAAVSLDGGPIAIHRTYLELDELGLAPFDKPRRALGALRSGGRIERELFDDDTSESWIDIALLEDLAHQKMEKAASAKASELGLAWIRPTLGSYVGHDLIEGLHRLPAEPAPLSEAEAEELSELERDYDREAAVLEDEDSTEEEVTKAEEELARIDRAMRALNDRPPVLAEELKAEAGAFLVLSRSGEPTLVPQYYTEIEMAQPEDDIIEPVDERAEASSKAASYSQRLLDELAMQRRDILAIHLANDPALALDLMVFTLADAEGHDWRARQAITIVGPPANGPVRGI